MPVISRLAAAAIALAVLAAAPSADPLLTKAQIAKGAQKVEACLDKEYQTNHGSAQKCVGLIDSECEDKISAGGEAAHATCSDDETAVWDVLLNKTWSQMPESVGAERFARLKQIQKMWLAYRDAKCAFLDDPKSPGAWGIMLQAQCRMDETSRRTIELREIMNDPNFAPE
jgi:uncharacterized protein YecT (DUF1311 family)